jgi:uncharacterized membrane protein YgcG
VGNTSSAGNLYLQNITSSFYTLQVLKDNYTTYATNFTLNAGQNLTFNIILIPVNQTAGNQTPQNQTPQNQTPQNDTPQNQTSQNLTSGNINITTNPGLTAVFLNNTFKGNTDIQGNLFLQNITASSYILLLQKSGYENYSTTFSLNPGQNITFNISLVLINQTPQNDTPQNQTVRIIAVTSLGFHPQATKQVIVYTDATSGTFSVRDASTNNPIFQGNLVRALDFFGNAVNCQGNDPCIVGDLSNLSQAGTYYITTSLGQSQSHQFSIKNSVFQDTIPLFDEFFKAEQQQNSPYHADMHSSYSPPFLMMADGSFIMEADQATLSLIRLGSAYRRNPSIFSQSMRNTIQSYATYLQGIQGLDIQQRTDGVGFRLNPGISVPNAFVPGPTNLTNIDVYTPGNPSPILNIPVISSCIQNGSVDQACVAFQAQFYKCQIDEPCLNLTYQDKTGVLLSSNNGFGVSRGWGYEFGCYFDVNLQSPLFQGQPNPCMIFYPDANRQYTTEALLAYLEAIPAIYDTSPAEADALFTRAHNTYAYIKNSYAPFQNGDDDAGFFGAALFLLYDYTNDSAYIQEAHSMANMISINFISDKTHGNEFYWEEYARHKSAIQGAGLMYERAGIDPAVYFRNKIFGDYKDSGPTSMGNNAERVYQFDMNIQFQNSRYILMEGLFATKAIAAYPSSEAIIRLVADNELAWMTGQNAVQDGVGLGSPLRSYSFIFGIGDYPSQFHSRYLINSGYTSASGGRVIGIRGTDFQFKDANNSMVYFDGTSSILGYTLGASGNGWHNEPTTEQFNLGQHFNNGKAYIPGWINGVYDINTPQESDTIFNYNDNAHSYEFTETTNEIVATAVEYVSALDALYNNKTGHTPLRFIAGNTTGQNTTYNITPGNINIATTPGVASVYLNNTFKGNTSGAGNLYLQNITPTAYNLSIRKDGYTTYATTFILNSGQNISFNITLIPINQSSGNQTPTNQTNASITIITIPTNVSIFLNDIYRGNTNASGILHLPHLNSDSYHLLATKQGYTNYTQTFPLGPEDNRTINITLVPVDVNGSIISNSTNLPYAYDDGLDTQYRMWETANATFSVTLNNTGAIIWSIDGFVVQTSQGITSSLSWVPGILYTSNLKKATVTATSGSQSIQWLVKVENVINPFFEGDIGDTTTLHIFTNNNATTPSSINVTLQNNGVLLTYALDSHSFPTETDWSRYLPDLPYGTTYLIQITTLDNHTGIVQSYNLTTERAHYRQPPTPPSSGGSNGGGSSGGGGGRSGGSGGGRIEILDLVYVIFAKDVLSTNETQTITLDAKDSSNKIKSVNANILTPSGKYKTLGLQLIKGTTSYGTWSLNFSLDQPGQYVLSTVVMSGTITNKTINVTARTFYVVSDTIIGSEEHLAIIFTVLNITQSSDPTDALLSLDARDAQGITTVTATITSSRNSTFTIPLQRMRGTEKYGSWEGSINAKIPDTTYTVKDITLSNNNESRTYPVDDRSLYIAAKPNTGGMGGITGAAIGGYERLSSGQFIQDLIAKPFIPVIFGFSLLVLVFLGFLFFGALGFGSTSKQDEP